MKANMMKQKKGRRSVTKENHFDRLADELLFVIISQIHDLKDLCQCLLVCKRFAQTVLCLETVSITVPGIVATAASDKRTFRLLKTHFFGTNEERARFRASDQKRLSDHIESTSDEPPACITSLQNFSKLKSVNVSFAFPENFFRSPYLKWKVKLRSSGTEWIDGMVALRFTSIRKITEDDEACPAELEHDDTRSDRTCADLPIFFIKEVMSLTWWLLQYVETLKSVVATTSENHCKLVLGDDFLTDERKKLLIDPWMYEYPETKRNLKVRQLPLPELGYIMEGVDLTIADFPSESKNEDPKNWVYEDGDELLGEVVRTVLDKYGDFDKPYWSTSTHD